MSQLILTLFLARARTRRPLIKSPTYLDATRVTMYKVRLASFPDSFSVHLLGYIHVTWLMTFFFPNLRSVKMHKCFTIY